MARALFGSILYIHFSGKITMALLFPSSWKLRKSKAVWYGRTEAVGDAAPSAVVCVDPIHCMVSGGVFFFKPDEGASRWVPTVVCKWRDIGDPLLNGWKYMGNWGYFTISGVMHPVGAYFVGMGPCLHVYNSLLVDCKTVYQVWSSGTSVVLCVVHFQCSP